MKTIQLLGNKSMTLQKFRKCVLIFVLICNVAIESQMLDLKESVWHKPLIFQMRIPSPKKMSDFLKVTQVTKIKSQIILIPNSVFLPPPYTSKVLLELNLIPLKSPLLIEIPALIISNFSTFRLSVFENSVLFVVLDIVLPMGMFPIQLSH